MATLIMAGQLLLGLGLLVFIHELGHFLAARAFGVKVEKFYIFFDFNGIKLFSKKIGDTEYGIGWFPLGGYVKIAGMIDESMDLDQMEGEPQPWELRSKAPWKRLIVMMGGIIMNLILGVLIFAGSTMYFKKDYLDPSQVQDGLYVYPLGEEFGLQTGDHITLINGDPIVRAEEIMSQQIFFGADLTIDRAGEAIEIDLPDTLFQMIKNKKGPLWSFENFPFKVDSVLTEVGGEPTQASKLGLQKNDKIVSINGAPIKAYGDYNWQISENLNKPVTLEVERNGSTVTLSLDTLRKSVLGFITDAHYADKRVPYNLGSALAFGAKDGFATIYYNAIGLAMTFTGKIDPRESVQSPLGIARVYGSQWIWSKFWYITGLISFILAFMNLLPIPALDGGHVMFILIEMVQGRPVSQKFMENAQKVGIIILLGIMVFAVGNDLYKIIFK